MADAPLLEIDDLSVVAAAGESKPETSVLSSFSLTVGRGETHLLVGHAGSGTSHVARVIAGSPEVAITSGSIRFEGDTINDWPTDVRSKVGVFLGFQRTPELHGISIARVVQSALSLNGDEQSGVLTLRNNLLAHVSALGLDPSIVDAPLGEPDSPKQTVAAELLQMLMLKPKLAVLDLADSLHDDETLELVATGLAAAMVERPSLGTLIMSRDHRPLDHLKVDNVHVLIASRLQ